MHTRTLGIVLSFANVVLTLQKLYQVGIVSDEKNLDGTYVAGGTFWSYADWVGVLISLGILCIFMVNDVKKISPTHRLEKQA